MHRWNLRASQKWILTHEVRENKKRGADQLEMVGNSHHKFSRPFK
jgi:hypothetical protein